MKESSLKNLSKIIYIISKISKILIIIVSVCMLFLIPLIPLLVNNINIEKGYIEIFNEPVYYEISGDTTLSISRNISNEPLKLMINSSELIDFLVDKINSYSKTKINTILELEVVLTIATLIVYAIILSIIEKIFKNIMTNDKVFTQSNINYLKRLTLCLFLAIIIPLVAGMIITLGFGINTKISINLFTSVLIILIVYTLSIIFEYGHKLEEKKIEK